MKINMYGVAGIVLIAIMTTLAFVDLRREEITTIEFGVRFFVGAFLFVFGFLAGKDE